MGWRRSTGAHRSEPGGETRGFSERIALATKPEPAGHLGADPVDVVKSTETRYQRRSANLPRGGVSPVTGEDLTRIMVDLGEIEEGDS